MTKRILAACCAAALSLLLLVSGATAADEVYFLSLNDYLAPLTGDLMPIRTNNAVYVPCTAFDRSLTGVSLGIFYGQDRTKGTVTLYSKDTTLIFDINGGYAYDSPSGQTYPYRAVVRNGRVYLPAYSVCQFFGLLYSALSTDYGPLIRIKVKDGYWLTDSVFVSSAALSMSSRLSEYLQSQSTPGQSASASPSATPSATPSGGDKSSVRVYLGMRVEDETRLGELLDVLSAPASPVLFFFRPSQLAQYDTVLRRLAGSGHQIGLLLEGETAQELRKQFDEGNEQLERILHERTYAVLLEGTGRRLQLSGQDVLYWTVNVDGSTNGRGASALISSIINGVDARKTYARVLLDDEISASALSRLLRQLKSSEYTIRPSVETTF